MLRAPGAWAPGWGGGRREVVGNGVAAAAAGGGANHRPRPNHNLRPSLHVGPSPQSRDPSPQNHGEGYRQTRRRGPTGMDARGPARAQPGGRATKDGGWSETGASLQPPALRSATDGGGGGGEPWTTGGFPLDTPHEFGCFRPCNRDEGSMRKRCVAEPKNKTVLCGCYGKSLFGEVDSIKGDTHSGEYRRELQEKGEHANGAHVR